MFFRLFLISLCCYVGASRAEPPYPVRQIAPNLQIQQLADGLYLHRSEQRLSSGDLVSSNGLILQTKDGVWLLDTAWGYEPTKDLLHWVDVVLQQPVIKAIATHAHEDRTGGYLALAERHIPLLMTQQGAAIAQAQHISPVQAGPNLAVGQLWQDGPVQWYYPGPGHSPDNIVLYLPRYQVLHGGCFIKAPKFAGLGYTGDAVLTAWPSSLMRTKITFTQAKVVIPGHGELSDLQLLDYSLSLFKANP